MLGTCALTVKVDPRLHGPAIRRPQQPGAPRHDARRAWARARLRGRLGAAALAALTLFPACYWSRYPRVMEMHLSLLLEFGAKLQALAADEVAVPAEQWGEFTYPLERARDFSRIAAKRYAGRRSLERFDRTLEAYAVLVADSAVLARPDAEAVIDGHVARLRSLVLETRTALADEAS